MNQDIAYDILNDRALVRVAERARSLVSTGLNAGNRYPEVWIRDLATFIDTASEVVPHQKLRQALEWFFDFQQEDGDIIDGYTRRGESLEPYQFIHCDAHPDFDGHKNTVEVDQESSLVIAVRKYIEKCRDHSFLQFEIDGKNVIERLGEGLEWIFRYRWSDSYGLAWNATTIDWGDLQPEDAFGVELTDDSHPALCIYTNAMLVIGLTDYVYLLDFIGHDISFWEKRLNTLKAAVRTHLWDDAKKKFHAHIYLEKGSPFPESYDESDIFFHGGTAVAMQAGLLSRDDAIACYVKMRQNVVEAGARSVGLTLWPLYDVPTAVQTNFYVPYVYQNGGDWPWWGGRVAHGLLDCGCPVEAYESLRPIVDMIEEYDGFFEWHAPDGTPKGTTNFRGAAGVVESAIGRLQKWASLQQNS